MIYPDTDIGSNKTDINEIQHIQADISIIQYICWIEFLRLLTAYIYEAIIISLSAISKNVIISVLMSSAVFILLYVLPLPNIVYIHISFNRNRYTEVSI